jgi:3-dehydroquinate dehydratase type I
LNDFRHGIVCVPIIANDTYGALEKISRANTLADILEIRLDMMESFDLKEILRASQKPALVTYRSKEEGGKGEAGYETQTSYLLDAMEAGADFVDVEYTMPREFRRAVLQVKNSCKVIISKHHVNGTPSRENLEGDFKSLAATEVDIIKIVTRATGPEDNLRVLDLVPFARNRGIQIIAFCMGPMGRLSRIASPLLGGYLTFASLEQGEESADGQIPVAEMRNLMEALTACK